MLAEEMKSKSKQRKIKNAIVDVDDVKTDPGIQYVNWISIVQRKLREREMALLAQRANICDKIIISSIYNFGVSNKERFKQHKNYVHIQVERMDRDNFETYYKKIQKKIIDRNSIVMCKCDQVMTNQLIKWNGIKKTSANINNFRQYFKLSKKWWDQRKIDILAIHFWMEIINIIQEFTQSAANEFFCNRFLDLQNKYSKYLNILILNKLFEGTMKVSNSRDRLIIPAGSYKIFSKENTQNLLINIKIDDTNGGKFIRNQMVNGIINKHNIYKNEFQTALLKLHYEVDNYGKQNQSQSNNYNNNLNSYNGVHNSFQQIKGYRYNPY